MLCISSFHDNILWKKYPKKGNYFRCNFKDKNMDLNMKRLIDEVHKYVPLCILIFLYSMRFE